MVQLSVNEHIGKCTETFSCSFFVWTAERDCWTGDPPKFKLSSSHLCSSCQWIRNKQKKQVQFSFEKAVCVWISVSFKQTLATSIEQNVVVHLKHNTAHVKHSTMVCKLAWVPWHAYGKSISLETYFAKCGLTKVLFHLHKWVLDRIHHTCRAMLLKISWRSEYCLSLSSWRHVLQLGSGSQQSGNKKLHPSN